MEPEVRIWPRPFTSALEKRELIPVLLYLPLHTLLLSRLFAELILRGTLTDGNANLLYYGFGFLYMLVFAFRFLRREYDALADRPFRCMLEVVSGYGLMLAFNMLVGSLLLLAVPEAENPNNAALFQAAARESGAITATTVYLAPLVEELLFRAGIFGALRRKSRLAAYLVSAFVFSLYHVLPYAVQNPVYWVFLVQYLPVSLLLARCYERSNCLWCSVFFHMLVNGVSMAAVEALGMM